MKPGNKIPFCVGVIIWLSQGIILAQSPLDSLIINHKFFIDWVRADVGNHFKNKDSILMPNSLIKIDLSVLPSELQVERAGLHLFVFDAFRPEFSQTLNLYSIEDNSWDSDRSETNAIFQWPTSGVIGSSTSGQIGWKMFDITEAVQIAREQESDILSLKWGIEPNIPARSWDIAVSPSWDSQGRLSQLDNSNLRPFVKIVFRGDLALPDVHIGTSDVQIRPRLVKPGEPVKLQAKVRNLGTQEASTVNINFFDQFGREIAPQQTISSLPARSGPDSVSVSYQANEGVQHIRVEVDVDDLIPELDETNNQVLRQFTISNDYSIFNDDFENKFTWVSDIDVPVDPNALGDQPVNWVITPQEGISYSGSRSVLLFLDGRQDDGAVWIERAIPVEPFSTVTVTTEFLVRDPFVGIQRWAIIAFSDVYNPEDEVVFSDCQTTPVNNTWARCTYTNEIFTDKASEIWVAIGIWARWETKATFYIDDVSLRIESGPATAIETLPNTDISSEPLIPRNFPNPFSNSTQIRYNLSDPGTITLRIFDLLGRQVLERDFISFSPGKIDLIWDGKGYAGKELPNGMYFYSIWQKQKAVVTGKMLKLK